MSWSYRLTDSGPFGCLSTTSTPGVAPTSTALNFMAALTSSDLETYTPSTLKMVRLAQPERVGRGGFSIVEKGKTRNGVLVAVKQSRALSIIGPRPVAEAEAFDRHFRQLTLEVQILAHERVRRHPHIVNILGLCAEESPSSLSLSIVLEYAPLGTLKALFDDQAYEIVVSQRLELAKQVGKALRALHEIGVCHGDVKLENVLVFESGDSLSAKISDLGQAVVLSGRDRAARVGRPWGTPLLRAPEVRNGHSLSEVEFNIDGAIATDVFSFGLLIWECVKRRRYFDLDWFEVGEGSNQLNDDDREVFLNSLPANRLIYFGKDFLERQQLDQVDLDNISALFSATLQDDPGRREPMSVLMRKMEGIVPTCTESEGDESRDRDSVVSWTTAQSLYEMCASSLSNGIMLQDLASEIQQRVVAELKTLANCASLPMESRAHAAMTVSECYTVGFGVAHDIAQVAEWLHLAATSGLAKAGLWYDRVCHALGLEALCSDDTSPGCLIEQSLAQCIPEHYLSHRIRLLTGVRLKDLRRQADVTGGGLMHRTYPEPQAPENPMHLDLFDGWASDEISLLHLAALFGDIAMLEACLALDPLDARSAQGFTTVHYACIGGHISILRRLLEYDARAFATEPDTITPLHLAIFLRSEDQSEAVRLLIEYGVDPNATAPPMKLNDHDLELNGTAMDWATYTRNKALVEALLPHSKIGDSLGIAVGHFFWEIVEVLCDEQATTGRACHGSVSFMWNLRPFQNWIAHGCDRLLAMEKTVHLCHKYALLADSEDGTSELMSVVSAAWTESDLDLIQTLLSASEPAKVRHFNKDGFNALLYAMSMSKDKLIWESTLERIISFYSVEDLQADFGNGWSYLHEAVQQDCLVAARVLLVRGVDVNQLTVDGHELTPLHLCMQSRCSWEMHSLLVDYGASLDAKYPLLGATPLQYLLMGRLVPGLTSKVLDRAYDENTHISTLHGLLSLAGSLRKEHRSDALDAFRMLLKNQHWARFINSADEFGATMLHKATYSLNLDIISILLEAHADATIPFEAGDVPLLPLQLACCVGRLYWTTDEPPIPDDPHFVSRKQRAMAVGRELLKWHKGRECDSEDDDRVFHGITDLHIAGIMWIQEEVTRLRALGQSMHDRGRWPGVDKLVNPVELSEMSLEESMEALQSNLYRLSGLYE